MAGGKRFASDFQRIDAVKPADKLLIQDSADGNVKFAFPGQFTAINGYKTVESVDELPLNPTHKNIAYVVGDDMYFWVGTGGDTLNGVYQRANIFNGGMTVVEVDPTDTLLLENNTMYIFNKPISVWLMLQFAESAQVANRKICVEFTTSNDLMLLPPKGVTVSETMPLNIKGERRVQLLINNDILLGHQTPFVEFSITATYPTGMQTLINPVYVENSWVREIDINGEIMPAQFEYTFAEDDTEVTFYFVDDFPFDLIGFSDLFAETGVKSVSFNNGNVFQFTKDISGMFNGCNNLVQVYLGGMEKDNAVENMDRLFSFCPQLTHINDLADWSVANVKSMDLMFHQAQALTSIDLSKWDVSKVKSMGNMFSGCTALTSIDLSKWDVSKVERMRSMFNGCTALTSIKMAVSWLNGRLDTYRMFHNITNNGVLQYNPAFDYSKIINELPATWTAEAWNNNNL